LNMPMSEEVVCVNYEHKETLLEGSYLIEIFNKGYLSGKGSYILRWHNAFETKQKLIVIN